MTSSGHRDRCSTLLNKTVLVTRASDQTGEFIQRLKEYGASVITFPTITIEPPASWEECDAAIGRLHQYDAIIFTSSNSVRTFVARLRQFPPTGNEQGLRAKTCYVVGAKTGEALEKEGFKPTHLPDVGTALGLAEALLKLQPRPKRCLFPKGNLGGSGLTDCLRSAGFTIDEATVYQTKSPDAGEAEPFMEMLRQKRIDVLTFFSPSSIRNFLELFPAEIVAGCVVAVIGESTAAAARGEGLTVTIVAPEPSAEVLAYSIARYYEKVQNS
jgi:uroporphyrinogen-III synthase